MSNVTWTETLFALASIASVATGLFCLVNGRVVEAVAWGILAVLTGRMERRT